MGNPALTEWSKRPATLQDNRVELSWAQSQSVAGVKTGVITTGSSGRRC